MNADTNWTNYITSHLSQKHTQWEFNILYQACHFHLFLIIFQQPQPKQTKSKFKTGFSMLTLQKPTWGSGGEGTWDKPTNLVLQSYGLQHDSSHTLASPLLQYALHLGYWSQQKWMGQLHKIRLHGTLPPLQSTKQHHI